MLENAVIPIATNPVRACMIFADVAGQGGREIDVAA
jgi:hypothetical protein